MEQSSSVPHCWPRSSGVSSSMLPLRSWRIEPCELGLQLFPGCAHLPFERGRGRPGLRQSADASQSGEPMARTHRSPLRRSPARPGVRRDHPVLRGSSAGNHVGGSAPRGEHPQARLERTPPPRRGEPVNVGEHRAGAACTRADRSNYDRFERTPCREGPGVLATSGPDHRGSTHSCIRVPARGDGPRQAAVRGGGRPEAPIAQDGGGYYGQRQAAEAFHVKRYRPAWR